MMIIAGVNADRNCEKYIYLISRITPDIDDRSASVIFLSETRRCPVYRFVCAKDAYKIRNCQQIMQIFINTGKAKLPAIPMHRIDCGYENAQSLTIDPVYQSQIEYDLFNFIRRQTSYFLLNHSIIVLIKQIPFQIYDGNILPDLFTYMHTTSP
jgi:hypothetical protein